jgi:N6-L-threonylcarbamoyladenine synthase
MRLLAIETSCDETAVCIINFKKPNENNNFNTFIIEKNLLISQIDIHREYGGVFPNIAKREHIKNLPLLLKEVIGNEKNFKNIDAVAVTFGPGLSPALWTGIEVAKQISNEYNIPLYPINHMEGHIYASLMTQKSENNYLINYPKTPSIALLISGGHTELISIMENKIKTSQEKKAEGMNNLNDKNNANFENIYKYKKIGVTLDDAVGEAFDKSARTLGMPYPGGPEISKLADLARKKTGVVREELRLPRPMLHSHDLNFSFSGLKTSVISKVERHKLEKNELEMFCMEFENAVTDVISKKTREALYLYNAKSLIVGGGVSANNHIRKTLGDICKRDDIDIYLPEKSLSTDNAIMIAAMAFVKIQNNIKPLTQKETFELRANPNLSLEN